MGDHPQTRLFVATDGSPAAMSATRCAMVMARSCGGVVHVVVVVSGEPDARGVPTRGRGDADRTLAHAARLGTDSGVETSVEVVEEGRRDTYEAILEAADRWGTDFLFVGRTGRHGPGRAMMGSQAEHVLEFSEVPVVVVPPAYGGRR
jgi:nucleotide-binding universal stress UspA family protein